METLISLDDKKKKKGISKSRAEALVKGRIQMFTCDSCGEGIEVINESFPERCPGCGLLITQWNYADDI